MDQSNTLSDEEILKLYTSNFKWAQHNYVLYCASIFLFCIWCLLPWIYPNPKPVMPYLIFGFAVPLILISLVNGRPHIRAINQDARLKSLHWRPILRTKCQFHAIAAGTTQPARWKLYQQIALMIAVVCLLIGLVGIW